MAPQDSPILRVFTIDLGIKSEQNINDNDNFYYLNNHKSPQKETENDDENNGKVFSDKI